jgi:hypothetical protein
MLSRKVPEQKEILKKAQRQNGLKFTRSSNWDAACMASRQRPWKLWTWHKVASLRHTGLGITLSQTYQIQ